MELLHEFSVKMSGSIYVIVFFTHGRHDSTHCHCVRATLGVRGGRQLPTAVINSAFVEKPNNVGHRDMARSSRILKLFRPAYALLSHVQCVPFSSPNL